MRTFLLLLAAVLHELGHVTCAALLHVPFSGIQLRLCGAVMTFDFSRVTYRRELCVHLAGGAFGIVAALVGSWLFGDPAAYFAGASVVLTALNLLPIEGLDGGGALRCLLSCLMPPERAETVCHAVSVTTALVLWCLILRLALRSGVGLPWVLLGVYVVVREVE